MIKAILFDFGQTLVDSADAFREAEKDAKQRLFNAINTGRNYPTWDDFLTVYRKIRRDFHQRSNFSRPAIWHAVGQHFKRQLAPERLVTWETSYWEMVGGNTRPFPETISTLKALATDYRLALVTNTQGQKSTPKHRLALFPEIESFFEIIIVAGESGVPPKPDITPFNLCLGQLNLEPEEALFIGDDWRIDILGAQNAGIRPIWLKHRSVNRNWPDIDTSVPIITGLEALLDLSFL